MPPQSGASGCSIPAERVLCSRATFENGSSPLEQLLAATQAHTQAGDDLWQAQGEVHHARVAWGQLLGDPVPTDDAIP